MIGRDIRKPAMIAALCFLAAGQARAEPAKPPEPYVPGLGDFMTAAVQPHHTKVGLAGHAGNWPLAEYEAKELRETFEDIATYQGVWNDFPIAKLAETNLNPPLEELDQAIRGKNAAGFKKAYDKVTAACNACHQATNNGFVVIKSPAAQFFPDQEFQPR
jgi:hypothetical protein